MSNQWRANDAAWTRELWSREGAELAQAGFGRPPEVAVTADETQARKAVASSKLGHLGMPPEHAAAYAEYLTRGEIALEG